jgi:hypothetical protein
VSGKLGRSASSPCSSCVLGFRTTGVCLRPDVRQVLAKPWPHLVLDGAHRTEELSRSPWTSTCKNLWSRNRNRVKPSRKNLSNSW